MLCFVTDVASYYLPCQLSPVRRLEGSNKITVSIAVAICITVAVFITIAIAVTIAVTIPVAISITMAVAFIIANAVATCYRLSRRRSEGIGIDSGNCFLCY